MCKIYRYLFYLRYFKYICIFVYSYRYLHTKIKKKCAISIQNKTKENDNMISPWVDFTVNGWRLQVNFSLDLQFYPEHFFSYGVREKGAVRNVLPFYGVVLWCLLQSINYGFGITPLSPSPCFFFPYSWMRNWSQNN